MVFLTLFLSMQCPGAFLEIEAGGAEGYRRAMGRRTAPNLRTALIRQRVLGV